MRNGLGEVLWDTGKNKGEKQNMNGNSVAYGNPNAYYAYNNTVVANPQTSQQYVNQTTQPVTRQDLQFNGWRALGNFAKGMTVDFVGNLIKNPVQTIGTAALVAGATALFGAPALAVAGTVGLLAAGFGFAKSAMQSHSLAQQSREHFAQGDVYGAAELMRQSEDQYSDMGANTTGAILSASGIRAGLRGGATPSPGLRQNITNWYGNARQSVGNFIGRFRQPNAATSTPAGTATLTTANGTTPLTNASGQPIASNVTPAPANNTGLVTPGGQPLTGTNGQPIPSNVPAAPPPNTLTAANGTTPLAPNTPGPVAQARQFVNNASQQARQAASNAPQMIQQGVNQARATAGNTLRNGATAFTHRSPGTLRTTAALTPRDLAADQTEQRMFDAQFDENGQLVGVPPYIGNQRAQRQTPDPFLLTPDEYARLAPEYRELTDDYGQPIYRMMAG